MDLQTKLIKLEQLSKTYCMGKVEGHINTPIIGTGEYYAYAKGTTYLASNIQGAVDLAMNNLLPSGL